jgi:hypothetical protein
VVTEDLVCAVEEKIQENRRFTISSLCLHFPQISRSLHEIVSDKLRFQKLCSRWVPTDEHKMKRQASALTFLTRCSEQGNDFLSRIITGDETWVSHVTHESKQQAHIIANKEKIQTDHFNSQDHVHSVLGQKTRSAYGILASRLNNQHRCLLRHT